MKEKKGYYGTEPNSISISLNSIILGKNVGDFFRKNGISSVLLIFDFKHNSIIMKEDNELGLNIHYNQWNDVLNIKTMNFIYLERGFRKSLVLRAWPLNKNSIIVENVPLKTLLNLSGKRVSVDMKNSLIIFGKIFEKTQCVFQFEENELVRQIKKPIEQKNSQNQNQNKNASGKNDIVDKGKGNIDVLEMPAENSPSQEEVERANKEYSKMILGE
jgi:hypothetical protein